MTMWVTVKLDDGSIEQGEFVGDTDDAVILLDKDGTVFTVERARVVVAAISIRATRP